MLLLSPVVCLQDRREGVLIRGTLFLDLQTLCRRCTLQSDHSDYPDHLYTYASILKTIEYVCTTKIFLNLKKNLYIYMKFFGIFAAKNLFWALLLCGPQLLVCVVALT